MKTTYINIRNIIIIFAAAFFFMGCNNWEEPEFQAPQYVGPAPNKTIKELLGRHVNVGSYVLDSICSYTDTFIVDGIVVSTDEGGNYYKSLVIQDETGAIEIQLDQNGIHNYYPIGQRVVLDCRGLIIGDYHNKFQVGWEYETYSVGRINSMCIGDYLYADGVPSLDSLPEPLTVDQIDFTSYNDVGKLVKLENCQFAEESWGKPFSYNDFTTEHELIVPGVSSPIIVRTSNYAKFRSTPVPSSVGTLYGILSIYNSSYQLMIRTKDDIQFEQDNNTSNETFYNHSFSENSLVSEGWSVYPENSNYKWRYISQSGYEGMYHQYNQMELAMDDWLISPVIEVESTANLALRLLHKIEFMGLQDYYQVYYTTQVDGEFNETNWHPLAPISVFPLQFSYSNALNLSSIPNNRFRIAIRYNNQGGNFSSEWTIKNIEIFKQN